MIDGPVQRGWENGHIVHLSLRWPWTLFDLGLVLKATSGQEGSPLTLALNMGTADRSLPCCSLAGETSLDRTFSVHTSLPSFYLMNNLWPKILLAAGLLAYYIVLNKGSMQNNRILLAVI